MDNTTQDSVRFTDYYKLRGTAAEGSADRWLAAVRKDAQKKFTAMDPMVRLRAQPQIERWVAGRYQNLLMHEQREVRQGRVQELQNALTKGALDTSNAIVLDATSEAETIASDRELATASMTGDALKKKLAKLDKKRADGHIRRMAQIAGENGQREQLIDNGIEQGLFSPEEGVARKLSTRHDIYKVTLNALLDSGNDDMAEAMVDAMQQKPATKSTVQPQGPSGRSGSLAAACGLSANELAGYRARIAGLRERKAAKAEADQREARRAAIDADKAVYNSELVKGLDPAYTPLSRQERLQSILDNPTLSPSDKESRIKDWNAWYDRREADAAERKAYEKRIEVAEGKVKLAEENAAAKARKTAEEETGFLTLEDANGEKKFVWISPTGWGKTGSSGEELISPQACALDPQKALVNAESMRATGDITKEDYRNTIVTCYYLQSPKIASVVNELFNGQFLRVLDTNNPDDKKAAFKSLGYDDPLANLGPAEDYDDDPEDKKMAATFHYDYLTDKGKVERKLFSTEERKNLFRQIGWMVARGYDKETISEAIKPIMEAKSGIYFNMLMERRMADQSYVNRYKTIGNYDESLNAAVGETNYRRTGKRVPIEKVK